MDGDRSVGWVPTAIHIQPLRGLTKRRRSGRVKRDEQFSVRPTASTCLLGVLKPIATSSRFRHAPGGVVRSL